MIFNPALEDGVFARPTWTGERASWRHRVGNNENGCTPATSASSALPGEPYAVGVYGDIERAKALTPADATAAWKELLSTASILWIYQGGAEGADVAAAIGAGLPCGAIAAPPR